MQPASIALRGMANLLSVLLLAVSMVSAQSVQPSNSTLPTSETSNEFALTFTGGPIPIQTYALVPLTVEVGKGTSATAAAIVIVTGNFRHVDFSSPSSVGSDDVAYISCDPNGSNIDPSTIVGVVGNLTGPPQGIVLYSLTADECELTGSYSYPSIFSMTSTKDSSSLMQIIGLYPATSTDLKARIAVNSTTSNSSSSQNANGSSGPAPTTAAAMSILYSITGIITLLFLVIIATGAVRAHRHPERYGPRNAISGRPRQSRAKGLARAMLETLPIVKFGDPEPAKPNTNDVELGETHGAADTRSAVTTTSGGNGEDKSEDGTKSHSEDAAVVESGLGPAEGGSLHSHDHAHDHEGHDHEASKDSAGEEEGHLGCSICTDDFCTGDDVRVLPCNHKFHPACVDPWLLNVSGTCPLCRHDLRPAPEREHVEGEEDAASGELPPPLAMPEDGSALEVESGSQHRSRAARLLDIHRLRHAPADERIAALRELREQSQNENVGETAAAEADAEEPSRRARVTGRLRDAFRIKTRTQDTPPTQ